MDDGISPRARAEGARYRPLSQQFDPGDDDLEYKSPFFEALEYTVAVVVLVSVAFAGLLLGIYLGKGSVNLDKECSAYTTRFSPLLRDVDVRYQPITFNGSFMHENMYRQDAGPEVDAAWEALGVDYRSGIIPQEDAEASGLTKHHVRRSPKYGGGYFANVEGLHHLHCLNLLRKGLYYNFEYYRMLGEHAFTNEDYIVKLHITHCLDTLRQVLMCNADTGMLGQVWVHTNRPSAFPDFVTSHKCKNFDDIREWAKLHQEPRPEELPPDYLVRPESGDVYADIP